MCSTALAAGVCFFEDALENVPSIGFFNSPQERHPAELVTFSIFSCFLLTQPAVFQGP
jgi:hypothetical protein